MTKHRISGISNAVALVIGFSACSWNTTTDQSTSVRDKCEPSSADSYFGRSLVSGEAGDTPDRYSIMLSAMGEPSLLCGRLVDEGYRVLVNISIKQEKTAIRVSRSGREYTVAVTSVSFSGSEHSQPVIRSRAIPQQEWDAFLAEMRALDLLNQRTFEVPPPGGYRNRTDGGVWVFEARVNGRYHVAVRALVDEEPARKRFENALRAFLKCAELPSGDFLP